jgi:hypothetical protein
MRKQSVGFEDALKMPQKKEKIIMGDFKTKKNSNKKKNN